MFNAEGIRYGIERIVRNGDHYQSVGCGVFSRTKTPKLSPLVCQVLMVHRIEIFATFNKLSCSYLYIADVRY